MKVLQLISGLSAGGAEHFVLELCRHSVVTRDSAMSVLTMSAVDEISYKFSQAGVEVIAVPAQQKRRWKAMQSLRLLLKQPHDVYHAHMFHACVVACIAKLFKPNVKVVFTLHNDHVPEWHRQLLLFLTRPLRHTDIIFPGTKRRWFQKSKVVAIPTGIDFDRFRNTADKPGIFTFLFAGRLQPEKNPLYLVQFAKVLRPRYQFHINVAGDGPLREELESIIKAEGLQQYFTLYGQVDDMAGFLSRGHCLLLPSLWEGMPMILLEAAASSLPVIATPTGNITEVVGSDKAYIGTVHDFTELAADVLENYREAQLRAERLKHELRSLSSIGKVYALHQQVYSH